MEDVLLAVLLLVIALGLPGLIWYFIIRKIVRGRRAAREVLALSATLTDEQADEFDRSLLPQARNIFEQLELMVEYVGKINRVAPKEEDLQPKNGEDEELKLTRRQKRDMARIGDAMTASRDHQG